MRLSKEEYMKRGNFYNCSRSLMMLAYVKLDKVKKIFNYIKRKYKGKLAKKLIDFFQRNYICGRFKPEYWNVRKLVIKTNNNVEAFHSMLNNYIRIPHPTTRELIPKLNEIIENIYINYLEIIEKNHRKRKNRNYLEKQLKIAEILTNEDDYNYEELLKELINVASVKEENYDEIHENDIDKDLFDFDEDFSEEEDDDENKNSNEDDDDFSEDDHDEDNNSNEDDEKEIIDKVDKENDYDNEDFNMYFNSENDELRGNNQNEKEEINEKETEKQNEETQLMNEESENDIDEENESENGEMDMEEIYKQRREFNRQCHDLDKTKRYEMMKIRRKQSMKEREERKKKGKKENTKKKKDNVEKKPKKK